MSGSSFQQRLFSDVSAWAQGGAVIGLAASAGLAAAFYAGGFHDMRAPLWTLMVGVVLAVAHVFVVDVAGRGPGDQPAGDAASDGDMVDGEAAMLSPGDARMLMAGVFALQGVFMLAVWLMTTHWSVFVGLVLAQAPVLGLVLGRAQVEGVLGRLLALLLPAARSGGHMAGDIEVGSAVLLTRIVRVVGFVGAFGLAGLPASAFTGDGPIMGQTSVVVLLGWACVAGVVVWSRGMWPRSDGAEAMPASLLGSGTFGGAGSGWPGIAGFVAGVVLGVWLLGAALRGVGLVAAPPVVIAGLVGVGLLVSVWPARTEILADEAADSVRNGATTLASIWLAIVGLGGWLAGATGWTMS